MNADEFLINFLADKDNLTTEMRELIKDASFRENLYKELNVNLKKEYHSLLLELLKEEMIYRADDSEDNSGDFFESIYWCSLFLYKIGNVEDVKILWKAKNIDFDTYCAFDIQFLVGAGVDETIKYLQSQADEEAQKALNYILSCKSAGDFSYLDKWLEFRENYFK